MNIYTRQNKENKNQSVAHELSQSKKKNVPLTGSLQNPGVQQLKRIQGTADPSTDSYAQLSLPAVPVRMKSLNNESSQVLSGGTHSDTIQLKGPREEWKRNRQKDRDDKEKELFEGSGLQGNPRTVRTTPTVEEEDTGEFTAPGHFKDMESELAEEGSYVGPSDSETQDETDKILTQAFEKVSSGLAEMVAIEDEEIAYREITIGKVRYICEIQKAKFGGKGSGAAFFKLNLKLKKRKKMVGTIVVKKMNAPEPIGFEEFDLPAKRKFYDEMGTLDYMSGHKNSPTFHGGYHKDGTYYVGMELAGGDLSSKVEDGADAETKADWLISSGQVLADLHANGRTHGDIKGDNFMVSKSGEILLGDYGESMGLQGAEQTKKNVALKEDMGRYIQMIYKMMYDSKDDFKALHGTLTGKPEKSKLDKICIEALADCITADDVVPVKTMTWLAGQLSDRTVWTSPA